MTDAEPAQHRTAQRQVKNGRFSQVIGLTPLYISSSQGSKVYSFCLLLSRSRRWRFGSFITGPFSLISQLGQPDAHLIKTNQGHGNDGLVYGVDGGGNHSRQNKGNNDGWFPSVRQPIRLDNSDSGQESCHHRHLEHETDCQQQSGYDVYIITESWLDAYYVAAPAIRGTRTK